MKRLCVILSILLVLTMLSPAVSAAQEPAYAGALDSAPVKICLSNEPAPSAVLLQQDEAADLIAQAMMGRWDSILVKVFSADRDYQAVADMLLSMAMVHNGWPTMGDYLLWHYAGSGGMAWYEIVPGGFHYTFRFDLTYYTTAEQETQLTAAVSDLLRELELDGLSDYQKVRKFYDYICSNITYDWDGIAAQDPLIFTAYGALVRGKAVCQGYANLLYRLCLGADIDCRIIAGTSHGEGHAWNIVKLGQKYYNLDATWDAGKENYQYFLCGSEDFPDHTRDEVYDTQEFHQAYPMSAVNYRASSGDTNNDGSVNTADVEYLLMHTLYAEFFPISASADYNGDGKTNEQDVEYLLMHTLYPEFFPLPDGAPAPAPEPDPEPEGDSFIEAPIPDGDEGQV